jgi:hypothetical protein
VDHQVEYDRHVGAALLERGESLTFDEQRAIEIGARRPDGAVEPLDVTHLQQRAGSLGGCDQLVGFVQRGRERLLHEHGNTGAQAGEPDFGMHRCRHGDRDGPGQVEQLSPRPAGTSPDRLRHLFRPLTPDIVDADQVRLRQRGEMPGMVPTQGAYPDDPDRQLMHHPAPPDGRW